MKFLHFCFLLVWMVVSACEREAEYPDPPAGVTLLESDGEEGAFHIVQDRDDNLLLACAERNPGMDDFDMVLMKTDPDGNILWQNNYEAEGDQVLRHILLTSDGGYLLAAENHITPVGYRILKLNAGYETVWTLDVGVPFTGFLSVCTMAESDDFYTVMVNSGTNGVDVIRLEKNGTLSGNFRMINSWINSPPFHPWLNEDSVVHFLHHNLNGTRLILSTLSADGDLLSSSELNIPLSNSNPFFLAAFDSSQFLACAGTSNRGIVYFTINRNDYTITERSGPQDFFPMQCLIDQDQNYFLYGSDEMSTQNQFYYRSPFFLQQVSANNLVLQELTLAGTGQSWIREMIRLRDGSYVYAGQTDLYGPDADIMLAAPWR